PASAALAVYGPVFASCPSRRRLSRCCTTTKCQGCLLIELAVTWPASTILLTMSSGTGRSAYSRTASSVRTASITSIYVLNGRRGLAIPARHLLHCEQRHDVAQEPHVALAECWLIRGVASDQVRHLGQQVRVH